MPNKADFTKFQAERDRFAQRDTAGFTQDVKALEVHIRRLTELAPKDKAGWPMMPALNVITQLQKDYATFAKYYQATKE